MKLSNELFWCDWECAQDTPRYGSSSLASFIHYFVSKWQSLKNFPLRKCTNKLKIEKVFSFNYSTLVKEFRRIFYFHLYLKKISWDATIGNSRMIDIFRQSHFRHAITLVFVTQFGCDWACAQDSQKSRNSSVSYFSLIGIHLQALVNMTLYKLTLIIVITFMCLKLHDHIRQQIWQIWKTNLNNLTTLAEISPNFPIKNKLPLMKPTWI